ncbi:MAG: RNB domain-containing ribonuclease [Acidobacteriota bacterium]
MRASDPRRVLRQVALDAMRERGLLTHPSFEACAEANALQEGAPVRDGAPVHDLRPLPWLSIDNAGTRTLDQATCAEVRGPAVRLLVAIADVDALAPSGSALDRDARHNGRSVYTPAERFALLPEPVVNHLGSLRQGRDRLAVVVEMAIGADGSFPAPEIRRARVRNQAQLAYEHVSNWLEGRGGLPRTLLKRSLLRRQIELHEEAAVRLRRHLPVERRAFKPIYRCDPGLRLVRPGGLRARELVEDLMAAVRQAMALFLAAHGRSALDARATAPNRRYADLATQRLVKAALAGLPSPWSGEELEALAGHCARREEDAEAVEQRTDAAAAALMLAGG